MMKEYEKAPTFTAKNEKGQEVNSDKYSGKYIVLYFYPKAFTPGCTKECNAFSENIEEFISFKMDDLSKVDFKDMETPQVKIVGISPDKPEKLADFKEKYNLKIELLSDTDKEIAEGFASLKENGTSILRSTFIIDPWGRIRKTWYGVKVKGHVEEVLEELKSTISEDMDINHQIKERRARRCFDENRTVSRGTIKQLIEAAHLAPSCFNNQPWKFSIINTEETLEKVDEYIPSGNYWLKKAPVLIAVHTRSEDDCQLSDRRDYYLFDTGLAVGNLLIQATQMGLIAHPVAGYDSEGFKEVLNIADEDVLITVIGVGFPADVDYLSEKHEQIENSPRDRIDIEKVYTWNGETEG